MVKSFFKTLFYLLVFIAIGAVAALVIFNIIDFKKTVNVPLLIGKNVPAASELLNNKGLSLEMQGEEYNEKIPAGSISRQDVIEGEKVKKGSSIKVFVSKGGEMFTIPYLEGMDMDDVELTLINSWLAMGKITQVHSDTIEKNIVIAQRPLHGYSSEKKINLLVSMGPYEVSYKCPSFVKMTVEEARKIAGALGLKLIEQESGSVVVSQNPEAGSIIKKGDSIEVTLGRKRGFWF